MALRILGCDLGGIQGRKSDSFEHGARVEIDRRDVLVGDALDDRLRQLDVLDVEALGDLRSLDVAISEVRCDELRDDVVVDVGIELCREDNLRRLEGVLKFARHVA